LSRFVRNKLFTNKTLEIIDFKLKISTNKINKTSTNANPWVVGSSPTRPTIKDFLIRFEPFRVL